MRRNKTILYNSFMFALVILVETSSIKAFERKDQQREDPRLRVELDVASTPPQQDFEQYVRELSVAAQREATDTKLKREEQAAKDRQRKTLNPLVLFRW